MAETLKDLQIIGANGIPFPSIGWLVPVLRNEAGRCFLLGRSSDTGFDEKEIPEAVAQGTMITLAQPVPLSDVLESTSYRIRTEQSWDMLTSEAYVFYYSDEVRTETDAGIGVVITPRINKALRFIPIVVDSYPKLTCYVADKESLLKLLKDVFAYLQEVVGRGLKGKLSRGEFTATDPKDGIAIIAQWLYESSYDSASAHTAIVYKCVTMLRGPYCDRISRWLQVAPRTWKLSTSSEYWIPIVEWYLTRLRTEVACEQRANSTPHVETHVEAAVAARMMNDSSKRQGEQVALLPL